VTTAVSVPHGLQTEQRVSAAALERRLVPGEKLEGGGVAFENANVVIDHEHHGRAGVKDCFQEGFLMVQLRAGWHLVRGSLAYC
jgi:hypothetical protein